MTIAPKPDKPPKRTRLEQAEHDAHLEEITRAVVGVLQLVAALLICGIILEGMIGTLP